MCGFCGVLGPDALASVDRVEDMTQALAHRGPDDRGVFRGRLRVRGSDFRVGLGHARLSILDLSPLGHQPMSSADGGVTVAYNGEIYNFRELREQLAAEGATFRSACDTEVLIEAYRAWGLEAFDRFVGMFAFAIWDASRERLVLARDRLGIKPLYYSLDDRGLLLFGSELHALRRHPGFRPRIDRGALGRYLRCGYVTGPETIYHGTRRLMPGEALIWEAGNARLETWWRLDAPQPEAPPTFEAAVDELDRLLGDAVEQRLVADVPLGAFLSGGIDSSTVVALMQERARGPVRTFSIGFEESDYDEAPQARAVAAHLGTDHTELYVGREQAVGVARELPDLYDEPFADSSAIPTTLLSRLTRRHVTVALSGDGGDELLGGYDHYAKLARLIPLLRLPRPLRRVVAGAARRLPLGSIGRGLAHLESDGPGDLAERLISRHPAELLRAACGEDGARSRETFQRAFAAAPCADPVRRAMYADARTYLPDDILVKVDRASMSVGLEARVPILDHRVVRFALSLPLDLAWHQGRTKAPLREVAYRRIPRALLDRPKHGFGIPIESLLREQFPSWRKRFLDPARLAEEGLIDPAAAARLVPAGAPRDAGEAERLWFLLCFERWFARHHRGEGLD